MSNTNLVDELGDASEFEAFLRGEKEKPACPIMEIGSAQNKNGALLIGNGEWRTVDENVGCRSWKKVAVNGKLEVILLKYSNTRFSCLE